MIVASALEHIRKLIELDSTARAFVSLLNLRKFRFMKENDVSRGTDDMTEEKITTRHRRAAIDIY